jgi:hypothetical protein
MPEDIINAEIKALCAVGFQLCERRLTILVVETHLYLKCNSYFIMMFTGDLL